LLRELPAELSPVEGIQPEHRCEGFDCGTQILNEWLQRYALQSHRSDAAKTFVVHQKLEVKAYYSLVSGNVSRRESPPRLGSGLGNYPIPIILLARLAVDLSFQRRGVGKALLKDAILRVIRISEDVAVRALIVDAIDDEAKRYYLEAGFVPFPEDQMRLMQMLKDLRASMKA
jgi:GNAT superfamily N-acetyltransferase